MLCFVTVVITSYCLLKRRQRNMPMSGRITLQTADSQRYFNYEGMYTSIDFHNQLNIGYS